jgi:hypothetical protein
MSTECGTITWRVSAPQGARAEAFDALVLQYVASPRAGGERHIGLSVPHEGRLSGHPHTLIVRARPGAEPLMLAYQVHGADGALEMRGRATSALSVIVRSAGTRLITFPDLPAEAIAPAT